MQRLALQRCLFECNSADRILYFSGFVRGIGGWFYSRRSCQVLSKRSPKVHTVSGHSPMHLFSLMTSILHATILVSLVCI
ncbi:unnamed protein product [Penicillium salamii]|nr:unnamed protein product [Penicillium salamii]CAG7985659.1 unnamed protein product [Penicillium salamii]CAG8279501.1 unnamed protein product [Penicillium salamii]